jgi:hypothetical protein
MEVHMDELGWRLVAAWVQAIGTIVALGIAICLPRWERRGQWKQTRLVAHSLAKRVVLRLEQLENLAHNPIGSPRKALQPELRLGEVAGILEGLPFERMTTRHISAVLGLAAICRRISDLWLQEVEPKLGTAKVEQHYLERLSFAAVTARGYAAELESS